MTKPRCNNHKDRAERPLGCATCLRISIEQGLVRKTVDAILAAGHHVQTDQGGEAMEPTRPTTVRADIFKHLMEVDDERLYVLDTAGQIIGWVYFVYGNDGWDVISDYTTNLETILEPVIKYALSLE